MKTIGLIGGLSWESSAVYYQIINQKTREILGGIHSSPSLMYSLDFGAIAKLQQDGNWPELENIMVDAAQRLERGGADLIVLCTNTMHILADAIETSVTIPFLHIGDATGEAVKRSGVKKVGLLGTKFTMEGDFLRSRLSEKFGIETIIPNEEDRNKIHSVIYNELAQGEVIDSSRKVYLEIIDKMAASGAEGVILGCTEIQLLVSQHDTDVILFDTTRIHAEGAVASAMAENTKGIAPC